MLRSNQSKGKADGLSNVQRRAMIDVWSRGERAIVAGRRGILNKKGDSRFFERVTARENHGISRIELPRLRPAAPQRPDITHERPEEP